ncbi:hypothetical protein FRB99_002355, partial [Tulasnella sp. 403]
SKVKVVGCPRHPAYPVTNLEPQDIKPDIRKLDAKGKGKTPCSPTPDRQCDEWDIGSISWDDGSGDDDGEDSELLTIYQNPIQMIKPYPHKCVHAVEYEDEPAEDEDDMNCLALKKARVSVPDPKVPLASSLSIKHSIASSTAVASSSHSKKSSSNGSDATKCSAPSAVSIHNLVPPPATSLCSKRAIPAKKAASAKVKKLDNINGNDAIFKTLDSQFKADKGNNNP